MIRLNLLPEEFRHKEPKRFKLPPFVSPKGLLMFLAALVALECLLFLYLKLIAEPSFAARQAQYLQLGPSLKGVREIKDRATKAQETNRQLLGWTKAGGSWTALMSGLSAGMEKGVWLTRLSFERRDFDLPAKSEDRAGTTANPAAAAAVADIQGRVKNLGRKKQVEKERRVVMMIRGRVAAGEDQAAVAGRFIENLKNQKAVSDLLEDLRLDEMHRVTDSEVPMFDFAVSGAVRRDQEKEFFNLP